VKEKVVIKHISNALRQVLDFNKNQSQYRQNNWQ